MKKLILALVVVCVAFASCSSSVHMTREQRRADRRAQHVCDDVHNPRLFSGY
jgi:hypothetical protein